MSRSTRGWRRPSCRVPDPAAGHTLSGREAEVLSLVAQGMANKQIARQLGISERTVKAHLGKVFRQIGVADRTSAALWAREHLGTSGVGMSQEREHAEFSLGMCVGLGNSRGPHTFPRQATQRRSRQPEGAPAGDLPTR